MSRHSQHQDNTDELEYRYFINVKTGKLRLMNPKYSDSNITFEAEGKLSENSRHKHGIYLR